MVISELSEIDMDPKAGAVVLKKGTNPTDIKKLTAQGIDVELREDQLDEMAKIAGDLKIAIEKVINANKEAANKDIRKAIKADANVKSALGDDSDLMDNQLNKFIDYTKGDREVDQRGRKSSTEPKEPGQTDRPKSSTPKMTVADKKARQKTFKIGDEKKYYADDKDEPSDAELRTLAKSGGKLDKSQSTLLQQQEKTKMIKSFLKGLKDKGVVDSANRVIDKEQYSTEWAKVKPFIDAAIKKLK